MKLQRMSGIVAAIAASAMLIGPVTVSHAQQPAGLRALRLDPATVPGGHVVRGTVEVDAASGPGGTTIELRSDYPLLAIVPPQVTIAPGATSATFPVDTRAVVRDQLVTIKARSGDGAREAELRLRRPAVQHASLDAPAVCDGEREGTLKYLLSGPAPEGLQVVARAMVQSGGMRTFAEAAVPVPTGQAEGSMRIKLPRCVTSAGEKCTIAGWTRAGSPAMGVNFSGTCGPSPY